MIPILVEALEGAEAIAGGGISGGSTSALSGVLINAFNGVVSGLKNLFGGASAGIGPSGVQVVNNRLGDIGNIKVALPSLVDEIKLFLDNNKVLLDTFSSIFSIGTIRKQIEDTLKVNDVLIKDIPVIASMQSLGSYDITRTGFVNYKFVSFTNTKGQFSGEKDQTSDIEQWVLDFCRAMDDLGFINFSPERIQPTNFIVHGGNAAGIVFTGTASETQITNIISAITTLINQLQTQYELLQIAIADVVVGVGADKTDKDDIADLEKLIDELLLNEARLSPYLRQLLDTLLKSLSLTKLKDAEEEEEDKKKKRRRKCTPAMRLLGMCSIGNEAPSKGMIREIIADVGIRSKWIQAVKFRFFKPVERASNGRGEMTFYLKDGRSYNMGMFTRGTFSHIVVLMLGTGYGWWSDIPRKKARLIDITTISYNLPTLTTQKRLKAIDKELITEGIIYN